MARIDPFTGLTEFLAVADRAGFTTPGLFLYFPARSVSAIIDAALHALTATLNGATTIPR
jgi:hypothetical protein